MKAGPKVHWLKPTLMVIWLFLGIAVALGHHFLYSWLDERPVQSKSEQEWYGRIGTGFAFLTNTLLAAASTLAYTQLLWQTLRSTAVTVSGVDALFGVTTNVWNLASLELWKHGPLPATVAVVLWLLPLSVVVTPSTLVVIPSPIQNTTVLRTAIPLIDHAPEKYAQWGMTIADETTNTHVFSNYPKPAPPISRLVANSASSGVILPIQAPFPNSSYSLKFYGPSISCFPAEPSLEKEVNSILDNGGLLYTYVGFVPSLLADNGVGRINDTDENGDVFNGLNSTLQSASTVAKLDTYDSVSPAGHARLFIATYDPGKNGQGGSPRKLTECGLYNSLYAVDFNFTNNQQSINVTNMTRLNGINYTTYLNFNLTLEDSPHFFSGIIGCSLMETLSKMLVGYLRTASSSDGLVNDGEIQITNTVLMETQELRRLYQSVGQDNFSPMTEPLSIRNMTIAEAIEKLSRNMTLSLFSTSYFLQDTSTASPGLITVRTPQNTYTYNPRNLALAYGLGIAFSTAIVLGGLICIRAAEGSFSASFSTILRMTRGPKLVGVVQASETHGKDPLPKRLAKTKIPLEQWSGQKYDDPTSIVEEGTPEMNLLERRGDGKQMSHRVGGDASGDSLLAEHDMT